MSTNSTSPSSDTAATDPVIAALDVTHRLADNYPRLATGLLAMATAAEIHSQGILEFNDITEPDEQANIIDNSFGGDRAYEVIYDAVQQLDSDTQLALIRGNPEFFGEYGFEGSSLDPEEDIQITATHCVRDIVWHMMLDYYDIDPERNDRTAIEDALLR